MQEAIQKHLQKFERSAPYFHSQNGTVERKIYTIVQCARTMLLARKVSKSF
ncbi:unnamed protein product [Phaeothamnion confervicola]